MAVRTRINYDFIRKAKWFGEVYNHPEYHGQYILGVPFPIYTLGEQYTGIWNLYTLDKKGKLIWDQISTEEAQELVRCAVK